jgi:hypothetical protein
MKTIRDLIGTSKGRNGLIVCAGSSIKTYKKEINKFIKTNDPVTIGINNITHIYNTQYHLWTNTQRFKNFGKNISNKSELLLGSGIKIKIIKEIIGNKEYTLINFIDKKGIPLNYTNKKIYGYYRNAGNLAIMILHLMGINKIYIVGMDGYSKFAYEDYKSGKISHHCYGKGYTDNKTWEHRKEADDIVYNCLKEIRKYGINFKIITPTMYEELYDERIFKR